MVSALYPQPMRWLLGVELARFRVDARLSMTKAAGLAGVTKAKVANIELGRQTPSPDDITRLLTVYGAAPRTITRLFALAERADEANWWTWWSAVVPPWLSVFAGLERLADREFAYEPNLIPGLLQTRDYTTAVSSESLLVRADHLRDIVAFREARAARLVDQERPLSLHCVITTWALEVAIGTPEVRRAQLEHLARMADLPTVTIQVLRPRDGMHAAIMTGPFVLLELDAANPIGYVELLDGAAYLTDRTRLATYQVAADDLKRVALNPQQSLDLIRQAMLVE
jgi:transcriptional regulator with XRE-family HTH domain